MLQAFAVPTEGQKIHGFSVTPDGNRAVYAVGDTSKTQAIRSVTEGGTAVTVAGSADGTAACPRPVGAVLAEAASALVACGGIRSYAHSGEHAPRAGVTVAGLNDVPGILVVKPAAPCAPSPPAPGPPRRPRAATSPTSSWDPATSPPRRAGST